MNAIAPGVYTKITTLESYVEEVPSSVGFIAVISDRGKDNILQYSSSREHFLKTAGKPNINKYGRIWAHGSLVGERFAAASPNLYWMRVLPDDATYANMVFYVVRKKPTKIGDISNVVWTEKQYYGKTKKQLIGEGSGTFAFYYKPDYEGFIVNNTSLNTVGEIQQVLNPDNFTQLQPVYVKGTHDGVTYIFRVYSDNLIVVNTGDHETEPVFVEDGTNIFQLGVTFLNEGDTGYDTAYPVPGQTFRVQLSITDTGVSLSGSELPPVIVTDYAGQNNYQINTDGTNVVFSSITDNPASLIYDIVQPLFVIHAEGRGSGYNNIFLSFDVVGNKKNVYDMTVYELDDSGNAKVIGAPAYEVSFDTTATDDSGESIFIKEVLNRYVDYIDIYFDEDDVETVKNIFRLDIINNFLEGGIDATPYRKDSGMFVVSKIVSQDKDLEGLTEGAYIYVADGASGTLYGKDASICQYVAGSVNEIEGPIEEGSLVYSINDQKTYLHLGYGKIEEFNPYTRFLTLPTDKDDTVSERYLGGGSDGSLFDNTTQTVNADIATNLLAQAYKGLLDSNVLNTEFYWFDLVFCGGYPKDVKDAAVELCEQRRDCIMIGDIDDNLTPDEAVRSRLEKYPYSSEFAALYEPWVKVRDVFSGRDVWVSPVYVLAYLIAMNDRIHEVWYATAGIPEGVSNFIKDSRYSPNLSEQGMFYLNQINPIVKLRDGYVVWGQLTTLREKTPLQDINIVRCVLYIKRALSNYFRYSIFKMNDPITWAQAEEGASVFVREVADKRGLYSFELKVYADEYMKKRKAARAMLILEPTRVLEKLYFDINVK